MQIAEFEGCCGITILHNFGKESDWFGESVKSIENAIKYAKEEKYGMILASINIQQEKKWKPLLEKNGFKKVTTFANPNNKGNKVTLFMRKL